MRAVGLIKALEDGALLILGDAGAVIADGDAYARRLAVQAQADFAAHGIKLDRVIQQVHPHMQHQAFVAGVGGLVHVHIPFNLLLRPFALQQQDGAAQLLIQAVGVLFQRQGLVVHLG